MIQFGSIICISPDLVHKAQNARRASTGESSDYREAMRAPAAAAGFGFEQLQQANAEGGMVYTSRSPITVAGRPVAHTLFVDDAHTADEARWEDYLMAQTGRDVLPQEDRDLARQYVAGYLQEVVKNRPFNDGSSGIYYLA